MTFSLWEPVPKCPLFIRSLVIKNYPEDPIHLNHTCNVIALLGLHSVCRLTWVVSTP